MVFFRFLALACIFYFVPKFCYQKTEGFALTKIASNLPHDPRFDVENAPLPAVFNQPFTYLAAGGQAYAFVSEDGQYVLKFFKHHLRRLPFWLKALPLRGSLAEKRNLQREKRQIKLVRDFTSYKIAQELLPEETGLLYVHLNKSDSLKTTARIVDKLQIEHLVDLDKTEFVLQKKAHLALTHIENLIQAGDLIGAKECIDSIFALIISRCSKGIYDEDPRIHRNIGFIGNQAIVIDVGRLKRDPRREDPNVQREDLIQITHPLHRFLKERSLELAQYLEEKLS